MNKNAILLGLLLITLTCGVAEAGYYMDKGCEYLQHTYEYEKADQYLTLAIENGDSVQAALLYRAWNYECNLKKYPEAIADYTRYLEEFNDCNRVIAKTGRGRSHYGAGNYQQAIADLTEAIDAGFDPNLMWKMYYDRAKAYKANGQLDKALEDCNAAAERVDNGLCYQSGGDQKTEMYLMRANLAAELAKKSSAGGRKERSGAGLRY